jgi:hypothetical protein
MKSLRCPNTHRPTSGKSDTAAIIRHGFYQTRWGKRRGYQCQACGKTFCSTTGTAYHQLQHRRVTFDECLNKSAIARVKRVTGEPQFIAGSKRQPYGVVGSITKKIKGVSIPELQADEI